MQPDIHVENGDAVSITTIKYNGTASGGPSRAINQQTADFIKENIYSKNTISSYQYDLKVFSRWMFARNIQNPTLQQIIDFFQAMMETKKISTLNRYQAALLKIYKDILQDEIFLAFWQSLNNKMASIPKHSRPLLVKDFRRLIQTIPSTSYQLLFTLQYKGAFRISEVLALRVKDCVVEENGLKIHLRRTKTHKEGEIKGVQEKGFPLLDLFHYHITHKKLSGDDKLFTVKRGTVNDYIHRYFGNDYTSHSLRAGHITSRIQSGKNIAAIMKTTGHKNADVLLNNYYIPANIYENTTDIG